MIAFIGGSYILYKNKATGKLLLVALVAGGTMLTTTAVFADLARLAQDVSISVTVGEKLAYQPQVIAGYEYVGYLKDGKLIESTTTTENIGESPKDSTTVEETTTLTINTTQTTQLNVTTQSQVVDTTTQAPVIIETTQAPIVDEPAQPTPTPTPEYMVNLPDGDFVGYTYSAEEANNLGVASIGNQEKYRSYFVIEENGIHYVYALFPR